MANNPLVSIVIPAYNCQRHLEDTLLSVFDQTYTNYEVIVVDDGSATDKVKQICDKYKNRVIYIRQDNRGPSAARNTGIRNSKGEYIAFLDDDDLWLPEKVEKQVIFYEDLKKKGLNPGLVYAGYKAIAENNNDTLCKVLYKSAGNNYKTLLFINFIGPPSAVLVGRSIFDEVGLFDENMKAPEDWDLYLRIARKKNIYSINEFLTLYRCGQGSLSKNAPAMTDGLEYLCAKILQVESKSGLLDDKAIRKLTNHYRTEIADLWKSAAYVCLFSNRDGTTFRVYIRKGYKSDRSLFGFKVLVYYIFSFASVSLCQMLKKLKKQNMDTLFPDKICNVEDLGFNL